MARPLLPFSHWQRFVQGLGVFIAGFVLMVVGAKWVVAVYYLGLVILLSGFIWAMSGYLGMLWQRLTKSVKPPVK